MRQAYVIFSLAVCMLALVPAARAQELAATMEVLNPVVEVQRINTSNRIPVSGEVVIVGVGDTIYTGPEGRALITFFADGTTTELLPDTEYRISRFEGDDDAFTLEVEIIVGQTVQQLNRALDASSSYEVQTPGMTTAARGTQFTLRVEQNGRAAMLVSESTVVASAEDETADVPAGFGVRSATGEDLSDVVPATSFDQLDSSLDGCAFNIPVEDDVLFRVRRGPSLETAAFDTVDPTRINRVYGVSAGGTWYRIQLDADAERFGWVFARLGEIVGTCAGLRQFEDSYTEPLTTGSAAEDAAEPPDSAPASD